MKGQQNIINEMFLFAFGLFFLIFVSFFFIYFNNWLSDLTVKESLETISVLLSSSILKIYETGGNGSIKIKIPQQINDRIYSAEAFGNRIIVYDVYYPNITVTQSIFYISTNKNINGGLFSSYGYAVIKSIGSNIELGR